MNDSMGISFSEGREMQTEFFSSQSPERCQQRHPHRELLSSFLGSRRLHYNVFELVVFYAPHVSPSTCCLALYKENALYVLK